MKSYLSLILILLAIIGGIVWVFINDSPPDIVNPKFTVGTITSLKQAQKSAGLDAVVTFVVEGKQYEYRIGSKAYSANVVGEKFVVVYEDKKPSNCIVLRHRPVFTDIESKFVEQTKGVITKDAHKYNWSSNKHIPNHGIEFEYEVNGQKFTKAQSLPKDYKKQYPNLKEGSIYEVEYWNKNPERAIIYLEKPAK